MGIFQKLFGAPGSDDSGSDDAHGDDRAAEPADALEAPGRDAEGSDAGSSPAESAAVEPPAAATEDAAPAAPAAPEYVKAGDPALQGQLHIDPARGVAILSDGSGRQVDPQVYRSTILPALIGKAQDNADLLYQLVVGALVQQANDHAIAAATRLKEIDTNTERGTASLAASLTQGGRATEAEALVRERLESHGPTGVMLYQLARALAGQQRADEAEDALWDSLEAEPNNPDSVQWWAMHKQQLDPQGGFRQGLQQADAIDGSWYAALWLARQALEAGDPGGALALYERALPLSGGRPDALALVSGDLGRLGHPQELLRMIGPLYVARQHGPQTGLNLALAAGQLGDWDRARALLDEVEALGVAAMQPHIDHLRGQLRG